MANDGIGALTADAQKDVTKRLNYIRQTMADSKYASSLTYTVRSEALGRILSFAAPRLRDMVHMKGQVHGETGSSSVEIEGPTKTYTVEFGMTKNGVGQMVPAIALKVPSEYGQETLFSAIFNENDGYGLDGFLQANTYNELAILDALDACTPHVPPFDGNLVGTQWSLLSSEAEMVRADGGFPGATCRQYLGLLRAEVVIGTMKRASEGLERLDELQADAGYAWGDRYLAYDDTDKRACRVPVKGAIATFHENIDLIDANARWVIGIEPGTDGGKGRFSVWASQRYSDGLLEAIDAAMSSGLDALGEPHVSLNLDDGTAMVREGFDPSALVDNVLSGIERDLEVFEDLDVLNEDDEVEPRSDFSELRMEERDSEEDLDDEVGLPTP